MEIEDLVDEILEKLYSDPQHPDKYTNTRIVRADIWSLVETYTDQIESDRVERLEVALNKAEAVIRGLEETVAGLA
jgi:dihydroneopterin aldolase